MTTQTTTDFFADALARCRLLAILRGLAPDEAVRAADRCWDAGVELVEVSLSHDPRLEAVAAVCARARERGARAGAGTVLSGEQVRAAAAAGAAFAVAPGIAAEPAAAAAELGLPYLPGVATPSEVQAALALGCRTLKLFPAGQLGPGFLRALAGPFPQARFVAVGGVTAANAAGWLAAGAVGVGVGSGLDADALAALVTLP